MEFSVLDDSIDSNYSLLLAPYLKEYISLCR